MSVKETKVRKERTKVTLPSSIDDGEGGVVALHDITLSGLETAMNVRKNWLAGIDRDAIKHTTLELRSIKKEIRGRAK